MDKNSIKKFAVWARRELITRVSQRAVQYEITEKGYGEYDADSVNGRVMSASEKSQRKALIDQIRAKGYEQVMEEVAYTWFNRFSALRFMEVNGYLPSRTRVFTDDNNNFKPQIITDAIDLTIDGLDMEKVYELKDDARKEEELYKYLLITQCNALSKVLPGMFQKISDYTELLFPDNLLREGSVVQQMTTMIPEDDWKDAVQIIGWLYQYYNTEKKDEVFAALKKNVKITKDNIPAATQLFTPDWIVRYMVENSLGRLWVEGHPNDDLKSKWDYYLEEAEQEEYVQTQLAEIRKEYANLKPEDIRVIDPCSGSGHILAYLFDVLMQIYDSYGYTIREAVDSIVTNNIYGLDIDERAAQLAYFAVMMKARQYDSRFLKRTDDEGNPAVPQPHVFAIEDSNNIDSFALEYFCNGDVKLKAAMDTIVKEMHDAKEYGSIITVTPQDWDALYNRFDEIEKDINMYREPALGLKTLVQIAETLSEKFHASITNPPYMGRRKSMNDKLTKYLDDFYSEGKMDLFSTFILREASRILHNGYIGMMTPYVWLYLNSYVDLRKKLLRDNYLQSIVQLEKSAFSDAAVSICTFVLRNNNLNYNGTGLNLENYPGEDVQPLKVIEAAHNPYSSFISHTKMKVYNSIPDSRFVFWITDGLLNSFSHPTFENTVTVKQGITTSDNERFLRLWHEVQFDKIGFGLNAAAAKTSGKKWFPYSKGGENRRWFGNNEYVINYENDGQEIKAFHEVLNKTHPGGRLKNRDYYFRKSITWSDICGTNFAVRTNDTGFLFDVKGSCAFVDDELYEYIVAFMNSKVVVRICNMYNPSVTTQVGDIKQIPLIIDENHIHDLKEITQECVEISRNEWNSHEVSWDFRKNVLINGQNTMEDALDMYMTSINSDISDLCESEEQINQIFINIYGLDSELNAKVSEESLTINIQSKQEVIKRFISYAVGCMFGRYSLDVDGLAYAGGEWDDSKYSSFAADRDNIIPVCDDEYFEDDIVGRFVKFVEVVYGKDTLQENLKFIADALGGKGQPKEVIRNYFLNGFYADHCKMYQKRPIYWLFDSGKKNGFKCLIYMHRYQPDTIARIRTDYVHEQQSRYRTAVADIEQRLMGASGSEKVKLDKQKATLQSQITEIGEYEEKIHHLADQMIRIDLDDGVKHNYEIFKDVLAKIK